MELKHKITADLIDATNFKLYLMELKHGEVEVPKEYIEPFKLYLMELKLG